jgi:hypothetical protein
VVLIFITIVSLFFVLDFCFSLNDRLIFLFPCFFFFDTDTLLSAPPSFSPTKTPTIAPSRSSSPTAFWTSIELPAQSGYPYLAMSDNAIFIVALPANGQAVSLQKDPVSGTYQIQQSSTSFDFESVSMCADGSVVIYAAYGPLLYSVNMNTTILSAPEITGGSDIIARVAISGDGTTVIAAMACANLPSAISIYIRPSTSVPFDPILVPVNSISQLQDTGCILGVAADYTGMTLTVLVNSGNLYLSNDQGQTWNFQTPYKVPYVGASVYFMSAYNQGVVMTFASRNKEQLYLSSNQGKTWTSSDLNDFIIPSTSSFVTIAGSYSGNYQVLSSNNAIYLSSDYGQNWTYSLPMDIGAVASDSTGMHVGAISYYDNILYLYAVPNIPTFAPSIAPSQPTFQPTTAIPTAVPTFCGDPASHVLTKSAIFLLSKYYHG